MGKGTPFTRSYLTRDVDAWNASGGRTHRATILFDEEVMVVQYRKAAAGGIVTVGVNGESGSYDVQRRVVEVSDRLPIVGHYLDV